MSRKFFQILVHGLFVILTCLVPGSVTHYGQVNGSKEVDLTRCWSYSMDDEVGVKLAADGIRIYVGMEGGKVAAISVDGRRLWSSEFGGEMSSGLLALNTGLYVVTSMVAGEENQSAGGILRSVSKETGIPNWTVKLPAAREHFLYGFRETIVLVSQSGSVQAFDQKDGALKWRRDAVTEFSTSPLFYDTVVIVPTYTRQLFLISMLTGDTESTTVLPYRSTALGRSAVGDLIVGDERGNVTSMVVATGRANWKFKSGGEISSISSVGSDILATSHDNFVYLLASKSGGVTWKKRLQGRVSHFTKVMDGFGLISAVEQNGAVLTDLANGKVAGQIVLDEDENVVYESVSSAGLTFLLTTAALHAYSLNGCIPNESGAGKEFLRRSSKSSSNEPLSNVKQRAAALLRRSRL